MERPVIFAEDIAEGLQYLQRIAAALERIATAEEALLSTEPLVDHPGPTLVPERKV